MALQGVGSLWKRKLSCTGEPVVETLVVIGNDELGAVLGLLAGDTCGQHY